MLPSEKAQAKKIIDAMMEEDSDSDEEKKEEEKEKEKEKDEDEDEDEVLGKKQDGDKSLKGDAMKEVSHALEFVDKHHECHSSPHETLTLLPLALSHIHPTSTFSSLSTRLQGLHLHPFEMH